MYISLHFLSARWQSQVKLLVLLSNSISSYLSQNWQSNCVKVIYFEARSHDRILVRVNGRVKFNYSIIVSRLLLKKHILQSNCCNFLGVKIALKVNLQDLWIHVLIKTSLKKEKPTTV